MNAGAIVTADAIIMGRAPKDALAELLRFVRAAAERDDIFIDEALGRAMTLTGRRCWSPAHVLKSADTLHHGRAPTLGTYFHQCAIEMPCAHLARAGRFLAALGPEHELISRNHARSVNALMMICGQYDGSGKFACRVGFRGKSGVGGGIMAAAPSKASIAVWSPELNRYGNALLGTIALEELSLAAGWSVFTVD